MTAMDFPSASMRAAGGDLSMQISPLGIIELSDEEFEVHGPRMVRYANAAAFYLGHHWSYRKNAGEEQIVINFVNALSRFLTNFTFSKGVEWQVDREFQHIIPALLERIWDRDNHGDETLWQMGQMGSIFGDVFVKVAYQEPFQDGVGVIHPGQVKLILMNPASCFPTWHPHDKDRLIEFKQKYRFWSTNPDGTRLVNTYTEIIEDNRIREYINDDLVRDTGNPLGEIPVVHIANEVAPGSPWGLSDIWNIIPINREYNEKVTEISEIINYYTAPITVLIGDKPGNLIRGPSKLWAFGNKDAKIQNLEGGSEGLPQALEFLDRLEANMHKMADVPITALGQEQHISNTSGVALAVQYFPTVQRHRMKTKTFGKGLKKVNRLALMTLFMKEPDTVRYDPDTDGIMEDGQPPVVDPLDPDVYQCEPDWPDPLPIDITIKLEELVQKFQLGIISKRAMLKELGEAFPDERLEELFEEQIEDAKQEASQQILKAVIQSIIIEATGVVPEDAEQTEPEPQGTASGDGPAPPPKRPTPSMPIGDLATELKTGMDRQILNDIVTRAFSPRVPRRRNIDKNSNED